MFKNHKFISLFDSLFASKRSLLLLGIVLLASVLTNAGCDMGTYDQRMHESDVVAPDSGTEGQQE